RGAGVQNHIEAGPGGLQPRDGRGDDLSAVVEHLGLRHASSSAGGIPSREMKLCMCAAGALRGLPASTTTTRRSDLARRVAARRRAGLVISFPPREPDVNAGVSGGVPAPLEPSWRSPVAQATAASSFAVVLAGSDATAERRNPLTVR